MNYCKGCKYTGLDGMDCYSCSAGSNYVPDELESYKKEIAELGCQMNRNKYCYSCANATDRCFRNEIGCPCEKYKSYKDENAEMKEQLTKANEIIKGLMRFCRCFAQHHTEDTRYKEAEQFLRELEE